MTHPPADPAPRALSDADLLAAWHRSNGEPGDPECDAIAVEIQRRGLDI